MRIKHRQQRQADATRLRGRRDPLGEFAEIRIRRASCIVVDIMKLPNPGEAGLQHLDIGLCGDGLDVV